MGTEAVQVMVHMTAMAEALMVGAKAQVAKAVTVDVMITARAITAQAKVEATARAVAATSSGSEAT